MPRKAKPPKLRPLTWIADTAKEADGVVAAALAARLVREAEKKKKEREKRGGRPLRDDRHLFILECAKLYEAYAIGNGGAVSAHPKSRFVRFVRDQLLETGEVIDDYANRLRRGPLKCSAVAETVKEAFKLKRVIDEAPASPWAGADFVKLPSCTDGPQKRWAAMCSGYSLRKLRRKRHVRVEPAANDGGPAEAWHGRTEAYVRVVVNILVPVAANDSRARA